MASLSSMCCGPFTTARITAIGVIVGFTSGGGTNGISSAARIGAAKLLDKMKLASELIPAILKLPADSTQPS
jgi:hypothetical protein